MKKVKMKGGLNVPLHGSVNNFNIDSIDTKFSAVLSDDYFGLKPKILIREGDTVNQGDPLFEDKTNPGFYVRSPVSGVVESINRAEKRALVSVVVKRTNTDPVPFAKSESITDQLNNAGHWDSFLERPFNRAPQLGTQPDFLFINACKKDVLEADPTNIISEEIDAFTIGLDCLKELTKQKVYLSTSSNIEFEDLDVEQYVFDGKYPSGNSSLHIQNIQPMTKNTKTWTINWQDVLRIGKSLASGNFCNENYVSLCGPACNSPKLIKTNLGANMQEIAAGTFDGEVRKVAGSLLYGRYGDSYSDYLTRHSNQISLVIDEPKATFFNWLKPGVQDHSSSNVFLSSILKPETFSFDTNINGGFRAIVPIGVFDEVNPFDIDSTLFLKSLAIGDLVALRELGIFDLAEEDMAIFSYVCPSKYDYVALFNDCMEMIWKEETS